jgi:hypothetical protein
VIADHLTSSSSNEMSREFETDGEVWDSFKMADIEDFSVKEIADIDIWSLFLMLLVVIVYDGVTTVLEGHRRRVFVLLGDSFVADFLL